MYRFGSSWRTAVAGNTPSVIGTVTVFPVRSSVIVMVSGMLLPRVTRMWRGFCPRGEITSDPRDGPQRRSGDRGREDARRRPHFAHRGLRGAVSELSQQGNPPATPHPYG